MKKRYDLNRSCSGIGPRIMDGFTCTDTDEGSMLRITVDNEVYGEYPLDQDQTIAINDTNICEIRDGKAKMIKADCPDHFCIKTAAVTKTAGRSYARRTGYLRSYIRRIRMQFRMQSHPDGERL